MSVKRTLTSTLNLSSLVRSADMLKGLRAVLGEVQLELLVQLVQFDVGARRAEEGGAARRSPVALLSNSSWR